MAYVMQTLVVVPPESKKKRAIPTMSAPVHLVNPDGTPYSPAGSVRPLIPYMDDKNLTVKALRDALIQAGYMASK